MDNVVVRVKTLGGFATFLGDREVVLTKQMQSKIMRLFLMLVMGDKNGVEKPKAIQELFPEEEHIEDASGAFRVIAFRLRKAMKMAGITLGYGMEQILSRSNFVLINPWIEVEVDEKEFEEKARAAIDEKDEQRAVELAIEAIEMYQGEFLPMLKSESWVAEKQEELKSLYSEVYRIAYQKYFADEAYKEALRISEKSAKIYPYEYYQLNTIECLLKLGRVKEAIVLYEKTSDDYFTHLGTQLNISMREKIAETGEGLLQSQVLLFEDIRDMLEEKEDTTGAYYCSFPSFTDIYRFTKRYLDRNSQKAYLISVCLEDNRYGQTEDDARELSDLMMKAMRKALRKGDIYTRVNLDNFVGLLFGTDDAGSNKAINRICGAFDSSNNYRKIKIKTRIFPVSNGKVVPIERSSESVIAQAR